MVGIGRKDDDDGCPACACWPWVKPSLFHGTKKELYCEASQRQDLSRSRIRKKSGGEGTDLVERKRKRSEDKHLLLRLILRLGPDGLAPRNCLDAHVLGRLVEPHAKRVVEAVAERLGRITGRDRGGQHDVRVVGEVEVDEPAVLGRVGGGGGVGQPSLSDAPRPAGPSGLGSEDVAAGQPPKRRHHRRRALARTEAE